MLGVPLFGGHLLGGHVGAGASDLLDGRLSPADEHRARLHLGRCPSCAAAVVAEQDARQLLRQSVRSMTIGPSNDLLAGLLAMSMTDEPGSADPRASALTPATSVFVARAATVGARDNHPRSGGTDRPTEQRNNRLPDEGPAPHAHQVRRAPARGTGRRGLRGAVIVSTVVVSTVTVAVGSQSLATQSPAPAAQENATRANVTPANAPVVLTSSSRAWQSSDAQMTMLASQPNLVYIPPASDVAEPADR